MTDARNFTEICKDLPQKTWLKLRDALAEATDKKEYTVYRWRSGEQSPDQLTKKAIVRVIKKILDLDTTTATLFPAE